MINFFKKLYKEAEKAFCSLKVSVMVDDVVQSKPLGALIQGEQLKYLLNEIISPYLQPLGLRWRGDYYWVGDSHNDIRKVFKYDLLKGGQATFLWGITLDFLPLPSGNKLVYHRTEKNLKLHLFEWPKGYAYSFYGNKIKLGDGVAEHWGIEKTKSTVRSVIDNELDNIISWYEKASDIAGIIKLAEDQVYDKVEVNNKEFYSIHYPPPIYVLAFLYAKTGKVEEAKAVLNRAELSEFAGHLELRVKALRKLEELGETLGT